MFILKFFRKKVAEIYEKLAEFGIAKKIFLKPNTVDIVVQTKIYKFIKKIPKKRQIKIVEIFQVLSDIVIFVFIFINLLVEFLLKPFSAFLLAFALIFTWILSHMLKLLIYKPRPHILFDLKSYSDIIRGNSFPSAHTAIATFLILYNPEINYLLIIIPLLRILGFEHYVSDGVAGILVGVFSYFILSLFYF